MIKGLIFDVDGTLLDSMKEWENAGARYLISIGEQPEANLQDIMFELTMEEGANYIKAHHNLDLSIDEIMEGINNVVYEAYLNHVMPKKRVIEFLDGMKKKNIPMCIATSTDRMHIEAALKRLDMEKYFIKLFTCTEVGAGKSEPKIFYEAIKAMGSEPENTWIFEDGAYAAATGKKAGFNIVGIYDEVSKNDQEKLKKNSDIYLREWIECDEFLEQARSIESDTQ